MLFTTLVTLGVYFYLLCVLVDPGVVPKDYEHDPEDVTSRYIQVCSTNMDPLRGSTYTT